MKAFAQAAWARGARSLASAAMVAQSDPDSAASRAYYAVFHAATAVFALEGKSFAKHSAVRAAVHRDLVGAGLIPVTAGQSYNELMDMRELGDYGGLSGVSVQDAESAVAQARQLIEVLRPLYEQRLG